MSGRFRSFPVRARDPVPRGAVKASGIALAAVLALTVPQPGRGQEPGPGSAVLADEIEEVVVTARRREGSGGNRFTEASRRDLENSDQTDLEGFFDDIDGLSTLGGDDQGNAFSIDGLSAALGNVTLNGQGLGEGAGNGGLSAGDLPPDMIRRVDLYRIPTAAMEEGGSAGSVNLQLRNPVALTGYATHLKTRLSYLPQRDRFDPSVNFSSGGPAQDRRFGHLLNASLSQRSREYAGQDVSTWVLDDFDGTAAWYPGQLRNNAVRDRQRDAFASLMVGFRPLTSLLLGGNLMLSRKYRDVTVNSLQYRLERQRDLTALAIDGRIVSKLESDDSSRKNTRIASNARRDRVDSLVFSVNAIWRLETWRLNGGAGYGSNVNESDAPTRSASFSANGAAAYRAGADGSLFTRGAGGFEPLSDFGISRIGLSDRETEDDNAYGGVDAVRLFEEGVLRRFRMGVKWRESSRERHTYTAKAALEPGASLEGFHTGREWQTPWDAAPWPAPDTGLVRESAQVDAGEWTENLLNQYEMDRRTGAAYLQADFRSNPEGGRLWVGNAGLRFVGTRTNIDGYDQGEESLEAVSLRKRYSDVLPSVTLRTRLAERKFLTLGAARVMTHPAFNDLAPGLRLSHSDKTGRVGNPDLDPFRAEVYLAELAWSANGRRLTAGLAYRDVSSYFALGEEAVEYEDDTYLVTRPVNGNDGSVLSLSAGLEQNLGRVNGKLKGWSLGFSGIRNRSSSDMDDPYTGRTLPLPGTAEYVFRGDLAYDGQAVSGKLSYQWRGESLKAASSKSGLSVWNRPGGSLNLNLGWKMENGLRFSLDGRNLLAEEQVITTDDDSQLWRYTERDRSVAATLQTKW